MPEISPRKLLVQLSPRSPRSRTQSPQEYNNTTNTSHTARDRTKPEQASNWQVVNTRNSRRRASSMSVSSSTLKVPEGNKPYNFNQSVSSPRSTSHFSPRSIPPRSASPLSTASPRTRARSRSPRTRSSSPIHTIKNSPRHLALESPGYSSESEGSSPRQVPKQVKLPPVTGAHLPPNHRDTLHSPTPGSGRDKSLVTPTRSYILKRLSSP